MSLIGLIDNIPLYTTIEEAGIWGSQYGLEVVTSLATGDVEPGTTVTTGYHTHYIQGSQGFMAGANHDIVMEAMASGVQGFLSEQVLSQGQFIITDQERNAYINNIPIAQSQPQTLIQPQTPVIIPLVQAAQPVIAEVIESEEQVVQAPQPFTSAGSGSSGGGGGGY